MRHLNNTFLMVAIMTLIALNANGQYVTTHAKIAMPGQQTGIYYALPRTVIQLDFVIDEVELIAGPYSDFVYMVGAEDYVSDNSVEYRLNEVRMTTLAEADPSATFFVAMNPKKGEGVKFYLNQKGILQGVGIAPQAPKESPAVASCDVPTKTPSREFKYQYGANAIRGIEQQARNAAEMITRIREEKIKLLTGFQETAFNLDTYRQMLADLDEMEAEYLSLFIGKRIVNPTVKTVYVTPSKDVPTQTIGKFSTTSGFSTDLYGSGSLVTFQALSLNLRGTINEPSVSAVESLSHENKLFYRIPETANVRVTMGQQVLVDQRATIAQYGVFMLAPLGKSKLSLDPETGQIIGVGVE